MAGGRFTEHPRARLAQRPRGRAAAAGADRRAAAGGAAAGAVQLDTLAGAPTQAESAALYDLRSLPAAPSRSSRTTASCMVVYNDQTLITARKRSPLDRGLLAAALRNLDAMGAKAIGIDILFDQPQDEDDELIATLAGDEDAGLGRLCRDRDQRGRHRLRAAAVSSSSSSPGSKAARPQPASIALDNADGVTRLWPTIVPQPAAGARRARCSPPPATATRRCRATRARSAIGDRGARATAPVFTAAARSTFRRSRSSRRGARAGDRRAATC